MAHINKIRDTETHFKINPATRAITNESASNNTIVQYDHESERFTFDMPRYVDGHDMSEITEVRIHYCNFASTKSTLSSPPKTNGVYIPNDVAVSSNDVNTITFSWLLSSATTQYAGFLYFSVQFVCLDGETVEYAWNTGVYKNIVVAESINNAEEVFADTNDVLTAYKNEITREIIEHITRDGGVYAFLDSTLEIEGAAADAKAVGDRLNEVEDAIDEIKENGVGANEDTEKRLKALEEWMKEENYQPITANLKVNNSYSISREVGESVTNAELTWSVSKETKSITLDGVSVDGKTSYTDPNTYTSDKTWSLKATESDAKGATATATATLTFKHRVYWGVGTTSVGFDSDFVKALAHSQPTTSKANTIDVTPDKQYVYYAIPEYLRGKSTDPTFIIDKGVAGGFEYKEIVTVINDYNLPIVYYVYRSDQLLVGSTRVDVS